MPFLGIDLGTSSLKISIISNTGSLIFSNSHPIPTLSKYAGWMEQDPQLWIDALISLINSIPCDLAGKIDACAVTGQMHTLVVIDDQDRIIRPAILWSDQRSHAECIEIMDILGGETQTNNYLLNKIYPGFSSPKLLWLKKYEGSTFSQINKIFLPKDFINYLLTKKFVSDFSDLSGTGLFNLITKKYDKKILKYLGIQKIQLPQPLESGSYIGDCNNSLFNNIIGIPVFQGGGDNAVAAYGYNITYGNVGLISLGTSGTIICSTGANIIEDRENFHFFRDVSDEFYCMNVLLAATSVLDWLKKIANIDVFFENGHEYKYPGSKGLLFLPFMDGIRFPRIDTSVRGSLLGLSLIHGLEDIIQSIYEGILMGLKMGYDSMQKNGVSVRIMVITGGGSKNKKWCQMAADVFNVPVKVSIENQGPSYGAAKLAARGINCNEPDWEIEYVNYFPNKGRVAEYLKIYRVFLRNCNFFFQTKQSDVLALY